jgi:lysine 2,3-aminomutase
MRLLVKRLSHVNVHPYYVYVHDLVKGVEDLRTTLQTALDIEKGLRGWTAGFNTPTVVVDAPGGGGKRDAHSYEHYDRTTGVSVYTAPSVHPGDVYFYFDPIDLLPPRGPGALGQPGRTGAHGSEKPAPRRQRANTSSARRRVTNCG